MGILSSHIPHVSTAALGCFLALRREQRALPGKLPGRDPSLLCSMYLRISPQPVGLPLSHQATPSPFRSEGQEEGP